MPKPHDEKHEFAKRLKQALKRSPKRIETPSELALQFTLRHKNSVSHQAAYKWMTGQARPSLDKIETLAEMLNVSVQWLRYGIADERPATPSGRKVQKVKPTVIQPTDAELKLLARLRTLPEHQQNLVNEIVEQFASEKEMWRE